MITTRTGFFKSLFCGTLGSSMAIASPPRSAQWEHKFIWLARGLSADDYHEQFNILGADGWELVAIQYNRAFFKRPK